MKNQHAFPTSQIADSDGMTLRDYFAAKALNGLLAGTLTPDCTWSLDEVAKTAYKMADEMLKAREA